MSLNLNDLGIFVRVVDNGGFSAASRALNMPKQTISKRVAELERRAGVRLIQRTSRSFSVTELGQELYRHASAMVIEAEAAESVILGRLAEPSGTVRITASVPTSQQLLAPLLPPIAMAYPKIRIALDASDGFADIIQDGYDIAVRDHVDPLPHSELVQRKLRIEPFWLVASPDYLAYGEVPTSPSDIQSMDGLFRVPGEAGWVLRNPDGDTTTLNLNPRYFANDAVGLLKAAAAGLGIASLPSSLCEEALRSRQLVRVLPEWTTGEVTTTLLMPHRRGQLPSVRVVADAIIARLSHR